MIELLRESISSSVTYNVNRLSIPSRAVQLKVALERRLSSRTTYKVRINPSTDSTPSQDLELDVSFKVN